MSTIKNSLTYPFENTPVPGTTIDIAPGVKWLQMSNNRIDRILDGDVFKYRSIDPTLEQRVALQGQHEPMDKALPEMV